MVETDIKKAKFGILMTELDSVVTKEDVEKSSFWSVEVVKKCRHQVSVLAKAGLCCPIVAGVTRGLGRTPQERISVFRSSMDFMTCLNSPSAGCI